VRVRLPGHLRAIAKVSGEVVVEVDGPVTQRAVLDAVEAAHPALRGTMRDRRTAQRRPFVRFFACEEDLSHDDPDAPLPDPVVHGMEPFIVLGAMAGG
jgi:molybdopterin converting factor small subunit